MGVISFMALHRQDPSPSFQNVFEGDSYLLVWKGFRV